MFNKSKKTNEIRPFNQKPQDKSDVVVNKDGIKKLRDNKDAAQEKSAMRSEGGKN